ncbi:MAG: histidinol-phosphate transaminase [Actinobacteria bacterium]|uniref:Unannotated protein n=1 Tax=freshwater metagenome TaxID=449393 RepID=A0A6J7THU0_9ZZZZ|nr:histidinol-phosphate transaminase [Actinomycetota bacterium]MSX24631.1 histidinol-phosphate transaminase [Actinomycetota bacterium]MSY57676.1 histidinol-phosphate transaminase [Actinomycetota bacterium]MTA99970.1 histidinol-phosphate transaminase [Actinomycetota bacterium]
MSYPTWIPLRKDLQELTAYGAPQFNDVARLNTNENPYPPSAILVKAIAERVESIAGTLNRYPDRDAIALRTSLAGFLNELSGTHFASENIWAANGSNEVIQSLFLAFGSRGALGFTPSYSMHPLIAKVTQTPWSDGVRRADFTLDATAAAEQIRKIAPSITFVTTPNNPSGTTVTIGELKDIAQAVGEVSGLLCIDEAYAEFSSEESAVSLIEQYPHVIVIRTMSKAFAFAGARLGYMAAHPEVIAALLLVRLPYHLSAITQAVALVALEHRKELLETVDALVRSRAWVADQLSNLGLRVLPSNANFLLFEVSTPTQVWQELLEEGVLIRDVGLSGYLRVTIGNEAENALFISSLKSCLERKS